MPTHVFKIVVTGPFAAGKTTFIETVVEREFLTLSAGTSEADETSVKQRTTIGMDFGALSLSDPDGDIELRVYGTPGQERFSFMWEVLAEGADAFVLVVDGRDEDSWRAARSHHRVMAQAGIPGVVAVNRAGEDAVRRASAYFADLAMPVLSCEAIDPAQVRFALVAALTEVLDRIEEHEPTLTISSPQENTMMTTQATAAVRDHLTGLVREVGGVRGILIATRDGHPLVDNLPRERGGSSLSAAAMIAALLGIGQRLSELTGDPTLLEATVRSPAGQVVIYAVGEHAVMTALTDASVNLARLNHAARLRIPAITPLVDASDVRTPVHVA